MIGEMSAGALQGPLPEGFLQGTKESTNRHTGEGKPNRKGKEKTNNERGRVETSGILSAMPVKKKSPKKLQLYPALSPKNPEEKKKKKKKKHQLVSIGLLAQKKNGRGLAGCGEETVGRSRGKGWRNLAKALCNWEGGRVQRSSLNDNWDKSHWKERGRKREDREVG